MIALKRELSVVILDWLMYQILKKEIVLAKKISILPYMSTHYHIMSKIFERILYKQIDTFMIMKFPPYLLYVKSSRPALFRNSRP